MDNQTKQLRFKTNIMCGSCIASVKPVLDAAKGVENWEVDTNNKDKILTVSTSDLNADEVVDIVKDAGYKAEVIND